MDPFEERLLELLQFKSVLVLYSFPLQTWSPFKTMSSRSEKWLKSGNLE